jgi:hypothetical protein
LPDDLDSLFTLGSSFASTTGGANAVVDNDGGISLCRVTKTMDDFEFYTGFRPKLAVQLFFLTDKL